MSGRFNPTIGILLIVLIGIPRVALVLQANVTRNYQFIPIVFITMMLLPFLFLRSGERSAIGIKKPKFKMIGLALIIGAAACIGSFFLANTFDRSISNWFVYISCSYPVVPQADRFILFLIIAIPSIIFSPIGEEFFYRGWVHQCFVERLGNSKASYVDGLAFALTHLAHFGIVYTVNGWQFLPIPAMLWMIQMFLVSMLFSFCRNQAGSIWGAIACHAGFNVTMSYFIVYKIL